MPSINARANLSRNPKHDSVQVTVEKEEEGWGALFVGALIGLIAGAAAGLWFAPESGAELRSQARERIDGPSVDRLMAEAKADARRYREAESADSF